MTRYVSFRPIRQAVDKKNEKKMTAEQKLFTSSNIIMLVPEKFGELAIIRNLMSVLLLTNRINFKLQYLQVIIRNGSNYFKYIFREYIEFHLNLVVILKPDNRYPYKFFL